MNTYFKKFLFKRKKIKFVFILIKMRYEKYDEKKL